MAKKYITHERLQELMTYDPDTGEFRWRIGRVGARKGNVAGAMCGNGYIRIKVDYQVYLAHRLAFFYMTGSWPANEIDHINLCKTDNRWENLRPATRRQNSINQRARGASGVKGVRWHAGKWRAAIEIDGKSVNLGRFERIEDAADAYLKAAIARHGEFVSSPE